MSSHVFTATPLNFYLKQSLEHCIYCIFKSPGMLCFHPGFILLIDFCTQKMREVGNGTDASSAMEACLFPANKRICQLINDKTPTTKASEVGTAKVADLMAPLPAWLRVARTSR